MDLNDVLSEWQCGALDEAPTYLLKEFLSLLDEQLKNRGL